MMIRSLIAMTVVVGLASSAWGEAQWTLTAADFRSRAVTLKSIDAAGVHVGTAGEQDAVIPFVQFLDVTRPLPATQPSGAFVVHLVGGDQLSGEPVGIKGNDLVFSSPTLGEIPLPMKRLVALTRAGVAMTEGRRREDVVTLTNGDTLKGIITDIANGEITVQTDAANSTVPASSVSQIGFAASAGGSAIANGFRVRFDDGSSLVTPALKVEADKIELDFRQGAGHPVDLDRVASIEQINGPVSWLSSRPTIENIYIPFIGSPRTDVAQMDRNWSGQDIIRFDSQPFAHGIGVHSYSRLSWELDGTFTTFRTRYAIDTKDANPRADVTLRILLDGKPVYDKAHVRAGTLSPVIVQSLDGAKKLTLEVDYGDNMDTQDRLNWIEPALLKQKPPETEPATTEPVR